MILADSRAVRLIAAGLALCALAVPIAATAHARFVDASPPPGAVLDHGPEKVVLQFNEPVQPVSVRLIDSNGVDRAAGKIPHAIDADVVLELGEALPAGKYLVSYRVLSGDAHPIAASFDFQVQGAGPIPAASPTAEVGTDSSLAGAPVEAWGFAAIVARAAYMLGFLLTVGVALFALLVPAARALQPGLRRAVVGLSLYSLGAALAYLQISGADMVGSGSLPDLQAIRVAAQSSLGVSLGLGGVGLIALVISGGGRPWLLITGIGVLITSRVVTGHPASRDPGWLLIPAMGLHVACAAFWYGSLGPLFFALKRLQIAEAAAIVARFATVALVAVSALAVAGVTMAIVHLATPGALLATWFGQLLLMKTTWFTVLLGFAAWNKWRLTPRLEAGDEGVARRLRISIAVEAIVMTLVVLISVNLASTAPEALPINAEKPPAAALAPLSARSLSGSYGMQLDPAGMANAPRRFTLQFSDENGNAVMPLEVDVAVAMPALGIQPLAAKVESLDEGQFAVVPGLEMPGNWRVTVEALINDFDQESFVVELLIPPS